MPYVWIDVMINKHTFSLTTKAYPGALNAKMNFNNIFLYGEMVPKNKGPQG